jgi:hypothetical protein
LAAPRALLRLQRLAGPPALLIVLAGPGWAVAWLVVGTVLVGIGVVGRPRPAPLSLTGTMTG